MDMRRVLLQASRPRERPFLSVDGEESDVFLCGDSGVCKLFVSSRYVSVIERTYGANDATPVVLPHRPLVLASHACVADLAKPPAALASA